MQDVQRAKEEEARCLARIPTVQNIMASFTRREADARRARDIKLGMLLDAGRACKTSEFSVQQAESAFWCRDEVHQGKKDIINTCHKAFLETINRKDEVDRAFESARRKALRSNSLIEFARTEKEDAEAAADACRGLLASLLVQCSKRQAVQAVEALLSPGITYDGIYEAIDAKEMQRVSRAAAAAAQAEKRKRATITACIFCDTNEIANGHNANMNDVLGEIANLHILERRVVDAVVRLELATIENTEDVVAADRERKRRDAVSNKVQEWQRQRDLAQAELLGARNRVDDAAQKYAMATECHKEARRRVQIALEALNEADASIVKSSEEAALSRQQAERVQTELDAAQARTVRALLNVRAHYE